MACGARCVAVGVAVATAGVCLFAVAIAARAVLLVLYRGDGVLWSSGTSTRSPPACAVYLSCTGGVCCRRACVCVCVCLCVFVFVCYLSALLYGRVLFGRCCASWCADGACRASSFPYGTRVHCPVHVDARVCICTVRVSAVPPSHCR